MERVVENGRLIGLTADMIKPVKEKEIKPEKVEVVETPTEQPEKVEVVETPTEKAETKKTTKKSK